MKYEATILFQTHPQSDFAEMDDEERLRNIFELVESAMYDIDDLVLKNVDVMEVDGE